MIRRLIAWIQRKRGRHKCAKCNRWFKPADNPYANFYGICVPCWDDKPHDGLDLFLIGWANEYCHSIAPKAQQEKETIAMPNEIKLKYNGKDATGIVVHPMSRQENESQLLLEDGTTIIHRTIFVEVLKVLGEYDQEGNPAYLVKSQNIVHVRSPSELRKDATI